MRSRSMTNLTGVLRRRYPGVVIYGVGNEPHKKRISDHNEDDTPGSKAAQSDADNIPEHRALDIMLGRSFTSAQAYNLIQRWLDDAQARKVLFYVIFDGWIWSRTYGWVKLSFDGDSHSDHIHVSGWAAQDDSNYQWASVTEDEEMNQQDIDNIAIATASRLHDLDLGKKGGTPLTWAQYEQESYRLLGDLTKAVSALRTEVAALSAKIG